MIALITPTGGRPKQIELCSKFMKCQDYQGEVLWILVDDCMPITTDGIDNPFRENWKIIKLFPSPSWGVGQNTQARNLLVGVEEVKKYEIEAIFIIEDDDYYSPRYLREMMNKIGNYKVIGELCTIYYNPIKQCYRNNRNRHHSSLFQTAFTPAMIPIFEMVCKSQQKFIDMIFYKNVALHDIRFFEGENLSIGIKGLSGRQGIGAGHRMDVRMVPDHNRQELKRLIGNDFIYYL